MEEPAKIAANWVTQDLLRVMSEKKAGVRRCGVTPEGIAELATLVDTGLIDTTIARQKVFPAMVDSGKGAAEVVESEGLAMVSDTDELAAMANKIVDENPKPLADVSKNPKAAMKYIGLIRKASGGRADVKVVKDILKKIVKERVGIDLEI